MKIKILILAILVQLSFQLRAQEKYQVTWNYGGQSFIDFISKAEDSFKVKFFFRKEWVEDLILDDYQGVNDLEGVLDNLFRGRPLYYFIDEDGRVVITRNFAVRISDEKATDNGMSYIPPTEYFDNRSSRQSGSTYVELGNPAERNNPGNVSISGYIINKDTKEPIAGVTVFVQELSAGTISNSYGFYTLPLPRGFHQLQFSFIGMKQKKISLNLNGGGDLNVEMNSVMVPLKETIVSAQKSVTLQRFEVGVEKINITTFRLLPTAMGESDIMKNVLLIPGVLSVGEGSAGFNVRGGSADQNLVLLYGAPVYNSSHFFGFFSAVNSDIIKDATLYKGGIPARYGGRLSSVLDIESREGSRNEFNGNAGISPVTTHFTVEGPIKKDTCFYIVSGRTTYSNWIFDLLHNSTLNKSRASFYDMNAHISYEPDSKNRIEISAYLSHDSFQLNSDTIYNYENRIFSLRWRHFYDPRFFSTLTMNNSNYNYDITSIDPVTEGFLLSHSINSTGFRDDFNWFRGRHELNFGIDMTAYGVNPGSYMPKGDSSLVYANAIDRERALESAFYFDDKFSLYENISVNAGIRFSSFFAVGPRSVLIYNPEYQMTASTITDTINYRNNSLYKTYAGPEIRLSVNFRLDDKSSLKVNYNNTRQYLHLLSNTTSISPTDTWKLSDTYIKPQLGDQYALGYYRMFHNNSIETSVEVYYKNISHMVDFKGGTRLVMNDNVETDLLNVKGKSYGAELMIKRTKGKIRGSLSYTYSRTLIKSTGTFSDEILNNGNWFPSSFDRPNDLIISLNYLISRRFSFSGNYTYSTGRPITFPVASYHFDNILLIHYSDRNRYRLPDYSRLDFSFKVSGNLKSHKIANPYWTFSIYNLLGRENVYSVYFKNENNLITGYKLSIFGRAIPTVTFSFDF